MQLSKKQAGERFKKLIDKHFKGCNQYQIGDYFECTQAKVSQVINGNSWPNSAMLLAMRCTEDRKVVCIVKPSNKIPAFVK